MKKISLFLFCLFGFGVVFAEENINDFEKRAKARTNEIREENSGNFYEMPSSNLNNSKNYNFDGKNELSFSYGMYSFASTSVWLLNDLSFLSVLGSKLILGIDIPLEHFENNTFGVLSAEFSHYVSENISVGLAATYEDILNGTYTVMPTIGLQYGFERVKFYHKVGVGLVFVNHDGLDTGFTYNITALGIKAVLSENLNFFVEAGCPFKGGINAGLSLAF